MGRNSRGRDAQSGPESPLKNGKRNGFVKPRTTSRTLIKKRTSRVTSPRPLSQLEETLAVHMRAFGVTFEREFKFHESRRWRFDFALPEYRIGIECEGLSHPSKKSRHTTNSGFEKDCEKYDEAALAGWMVLRFTWNMIKSGVAIKMINRAIENYRDETVSLKVPRSQNATRGR